MKKNLSFKNLNPWQEEYINRVIISKLEKLDFSIKSNFKRSKSGKIKGVVFASNRWGDIYAKAEKKDILALSNELEARLLNQLSKKKSKIISGRRGGSFKTGLFEYTDVA